MDQPTLHLASSSPRRRQLLAALGLHFTHGGSDVDESRLDGETVEAMALRLAADKALAVLPAVHGERPVLAADTIVVVDDQVFGKPADERDALAMLKALSGRGHRVLTGVALRHGDELLTALSATDVQFRDIGPDEARAYWHSGEPAGKAGAYAIQGFGGVFVRSIRGSYSGVVGLPVYETAELLKRCGIDVLQLADRQ
jgi:septum formation protein